MAEKIVRNAEKTAETAKKTAAKTTDAAKKTAAKATETAKKTTEAAKKTEPAKKAASAAKKAEPAVIEREPVTNPSRSIPLRIGAIVLWVLALGFELLAIMALLKNFTIHFTKNGNTNMWILLIGCIVLDMAFAILAAQLWKKANRISPMSKSKRGAFLFYLWNELGVIMACICFIPLIILLLKNDKLDKKMKTVVTAIAALALVITGLASADYHPVDADDKLDAQTAFADTDVYWTQFGHVYHLDPDKCYHIANREGYHGSITEAIESGKTRICSNCEANALKEDNPWGIKESIVNYLKGEKTKEAEKDGEKDVNESDPDKAIESTGELVLVP